MQNSVKVALIAILLCVAATTCVGALTIKLGTLAPPGSPLDLALQRLGAQWYTISGGSIVLRVYAGGVAGDEPDIIRKMRFGELNAAGITMSGLQTIFHGFATLNYPLLIRSSGELDYVLNRMEPFFEQELEKHGFHAVMWSPGGWTNLFSRRPVLDPEDLKSQKLWVWLAGPDQVHAYQQAGFQTVTLSAPDLTMSLQNGMVDALVTSPLLAASNQWFGVLRNMSTLRLGPLVGAVIVSDRTWSEVPADLRPRLIEAARTIAGTLEPELENADQKAITVMKKYGLTVNTVSGKAKAEWTALLERTFTPLVGATYDKVSFDLARKYLAEYLASHPRHTALLPAGPRVSSRED